MVAPNNGPFVSRKPALLAIGAGIVLLARPIQGTLTLTIVVSIYFIAKGFATIIYALQHLRPDKPQADDCQGRA